MFPFSSVFEGVPNKQVTLRKLSFGMRAAFVLAACVAAVAAQGTVTNATVRPVNYALLIPTGENKWGESGQCMRAAEHWEASLVAVVSAAPPLGFFFCFSQSSWVVPRGRPVRGPWPACGYGTGTCGPTLSFLG